MNSWGISATFDVMNCESGLIRSKEKIQDYVIQLCKLIDMKRHGDVIIEHFGEGNKEGFSMVQLIETSCITGHFANDSNTAFIDVFSCKEFDVNAVAIFTQKFFDGGKVYTTVRNRYVI